MCWQCYPRPDRYLPDAELVSSADDSLVIWWCGFVFRTNSDANWLFAGEALPGDMDAEGIPFFLDIHPAPRPKHVRTWEEKILAAYPELRPYPVSRWPDEMQRRGLQE